MSKNKGVRKKVIDNQEKSDNILNMSWKPEYLVSGKWSTNSLRFATKEEAEGSVRELMSRWWVPEDGRATECEDVVNYKFVDGRNVSV